MEMEIERRGYEGVAVERRVLLGIPWVSHGERSEWEQLLKEHEERGRYCKLYRLLSCVLKNKKYKGAQEPFLWAEQNVEELDSDVEVTASCLYW